MEAKRIIQVYEQLLAQNPAYRKKIGAFYTPAFIVNYMVSVCVSKALENQTPTASTKVRIIDPACGGGAFLVGAYEYLLNYFSQSQQKILDLSERKAILFNHIFGVDIDAEALKVCKQALLMVCFQTDNPTDIDIELLNQNIKCGNSLVSRFAIDSDLKEALKKSKWNIDSYRNAVATYRNATDKEQKREMERLIASIKADCRTEIAKNDPKVAKKRKLEGELFNLTNQNSVFELSEKEQKEKAKKADLIAKEIATLEAEIEEMKNNSIFDNAFEWRFEFPEVLNDEGDFMGFDVVIGNPPYIQLQSMKETSEQLKKFEYKTYEKTGDIYSLFYEKGNAILKNAGYLAYITSNKWMRAGYGKTTRNYFLANTQPELLIDLGSGIFEEATVDSNILIFRKQANEKPFEALDISKEKNVFDLDRLRNKSLIINPLENESWTIANPLEQSIKRKIEKIGKPLKNWNIQINYGVKTGYNEAFIIDGKKKDELIAQDPKSAEIIKPILRGRDIKRYKTEFADLWLIATFPALKLNIEKYPAVKNYLQSFGKRLQQTGESFIDANGNKATSRKKTGNEWFETQDQIAYHQELEKEKIVYNDICQKLTFSLVSKEILFNNTAYSLNVNSKYLLAVLNSHLIDWYYRTLSVQLGEKAVRMFTIYVENIPIPQLSKAEQKPFISLVKKILTKKDKGEDTTSLEAEIDQLVYQLYDLTEEEIKIVDGV
jgi:adenine-specific DNA-methyltransferase